MSSESFSNEASSSEKVPHKKCGQCKQWKKEKLEMDWRSGRKVCAECKKLLAEHRGY